jgi:hypothetical protein
MVIKSPHIELAVRVAVDAGNIVKEVCEGWTKVEKVVYMKKSLTEPVRHDIQQLVPSLRYFITEKTPHNLAEDGFMCDEYKMALAFPRN